MINAITEALKLIISAIGQIIRAFPEMLGIDEWYLLYVIIGIISQFLAIIFKSKNFTLLTVGIIIIIIIATLTA